MSDLAVYSYWPLEITVAKNKRSLVIEFDDSSIFTYPAEYLRVESPSAEVKGHSASQKKIIPQCRNVKIETLETVGNYAVRICFDDRHSTGIYSWSYLYELGSDYSQIWTRYLSLLESLGLSRE